jgi:hypothetical protein
VAKNLDPLEVIFEKHFYESGTRSHDEFKDIVVRDYLNYLKYSGAIIPIGKEKMIIEEVNEEVNEKVSQVLKKRTSINKYLDSLENIFELQQQSQRNYFRLY